MLEHDYLCHYGILGMKWGIRRFQNSDGSLTPEGRERYGSGSVFISGSSKTQDKSSGYYRAQLPRGVRKKIDGYIKAGKQINVGDAPGIDRQVQEYLKSKGYKNVTVYGPGKQVRYAADSKWKTKPVDKKDAKEGSKEWLAEKDKAMERDSSEGLAVILPKGGAGATRNNIDRLMSNGKKVTVYELSDKTKLLDRKVDPKSITKEKRTDRLLEDALGSMKDFKYEEFTELKSPSETEKTKSGSCHDQMLYEYKLLKKSGLKPKATFVVEYDPTTGQGGETHSFVWIKNNGKIQWIENAWGGNEGIHEFKSYGDLKKDIKNKHANGEFGNSKEYASIELKKFNPEKLKPGYDLQQVVDAAFTGKSSRSDWVSVQKAIMKELNKTHVDEATILAMAYKISKMKLPD